MDQWNDQNGIHAGEAVSKHERCEHPRRVGEIMRKRETNKELDKALHILMNLEATPPKPIDAAQPVGEPVRGKASRLDGWIESGAIKIVGEPKPAPQEIDMNQPFVFDPYMYDADDGEIVRFKTAEEMAVEVVRVSSELSGNSGGLAPQPAPQAHQHKFMDGFCSCGEADSPIGPRDEAGRHFGIEPAPQATPDASFEGWLGKELPVIAQRKDIHGVILRGWIRRGWNASKAYYEQLAPAFSTFTFTDPTEPCDYWVSGAHILAPDGSCRCGKKFKIIAGE